MPKSLLQPLLIFAALGVGMAALKMRYLVFAVVTAVVIFALGAPSDWHRFLRVVAAGIGFFAGREVLEKYI